MTEIVFALKIFSQVDELSHSRYTTILCVIHALLYFFCYCANENIELGIQCFNPLIRVRVLFLTLNYSLL